MTGSETTLSLVLGSGGARGHAHLGIIRAIEERGLKILNISGTSMGAVIGGIYAADEIDTYSEWASELSKRDVVRLLDISFTWTSIFKGEKIFDVLKEIIGDCQIEDLDRGFTAVATDIEDQREVWINKGSLFQAIRASTAVPGVFSPVDLDGRTLVDGGLVNPIPIAPTLNDATDLTIAVNLNASDKNNNISTSDEESSSPSQSDRHRASISGFLDELLSNDDKQDKAPDAAELLTKSIDVMQGAIARLKLAAYTPDKVIDIPRNACLFFDFHRTAEMRDLGYRRASAALDELGL